MITLTGVMDNEQVYRSYAEELTRHATALVGPADAADVVTDACLKAFDSRSWPEVSDRRACLYRTVLSVANDHHRRSLSRRLREMKAAERDAIEPVEVDVVVSTWNGCLFASAQRSSSRIGRTCQSRRWRSGWGYPPAPSSGIWPGLGSD